MRSTVATRTVLVLSFALSLACGDGGTIDLDAASGDDGGAADGGVAGDGGADGDGAIADRDGGPPGPCTALGIADDFAGPALDETRWRSIGAMGMSAEIVDGRLTFVPTPDFTGTRVLLLRSVDDFDPTGCATRVEVPRALPDGVSGEVAWSWQVGESTVLVRVMRPQIQFAVTEPGGVDEAFQPYDATAHRWWRIREDAGVLYLETSPTGTEWTVQLEHPHALDLTAVRIGFYVGVNAIVADYEGPQFDSLTTGE